MSEIFFQAQLIFLVRITRFIRYSRFMSVNRCLDWIVPSSRLREKRICLPHFSETDCRNAEEKIKSYDLHFKSEMRRVKTFSTEDRSNSSSNQILKLVVPEKTLLIALRVYDTLERIPKYKKMDSFIFTRVDSLKLSWILNTVMATFASLHCPDLLIIDCGSSSTEQHLQTLWNPLCEIMAKNIDKKMIVITQNVEALGTRFKLRHETYHGNNDDHSFVNLSNESQKKLLGKVVTKFQGQKNETSFAELLGILDPGNLKAAELKDLLEIIDSDTLIELICNDEIQIGDELEGSEEIREYYIYRKVYRLVVIKQDILEDQEIPDLLAISSANGELPSELMQIGKTSLTTRNSVADVFTVSRIETLSTAQNPTNFIILNTGQEEEQFKALCAENEHRTIHWLRKESDKYIWKESQGDIARLVPYKDIRVSNDEKDGTGATDLSESQIAARDEPVIISDLAGMGESAILTYLACEIKKNNPDILVLKIDLNHRQNALVKASQKSTSYDLGSISGAVQFLVKELLGHETNFAKKVFKRIIKKQAKVALIFDQFDEISPTHESTVINSLQTLLNCGTKKLFVATRPHTRATLESKLNAFSHEIRPLSSDDQEGFLTKFWTTKLGSHHDSERTRTYAKAVMKKLADSIKDQRNKFTGIPLQMRLVAEIFECHNQGNGENFDSCKEFVNAKVDQPKFPEKINLAYLYEHFVEKKFDNYFKNTSNNIPSEAVKELRILRYDKFIETHEKLALYALFDKDEVNKLLHCRKDVSYKLLEPTNLSIVEERIGIITQFIDDCAHFGHPTYAEYFAAKFFSDMLKKRDQNQTLQEIFVAEVLLARNYKTMRAFMNCLLSDEHIDVLEGESWKFYLNMYRSEVNETIFHVAAAEDNDHIIRLFLNCLDTNPRVRRDLINVKDSFRRTAVHRAVEYGYLDGIKLLVEHTYYEINSQDMLGQTPLHLAADKGLDIVKYLLDKGAKINSRTKKGFMPSHLAAMSGKLDVVKYLLDEGDIDSQTNNGFTLLHLAACRGELDVVKYLLGKGADTDSQTNNGFTLLHLAACRGELDVVKYLLDKGANIKSPENNGLTPREVAAIFGESDIVKYLLDKGANINSQDNNGSTPLHIAAQQSKFGLIKYLLDEGADINSENKDGLTLLDITTRMGESDRIKYFLPTLADTSCQTKKNATPLRVAVQKDILNVKKDYIFSFDRMITFVFFIILIIIVIILSSHAIAS